MRIKALRKLVEAFEENVNLRMRALEQEERLKRERSLIEKKLEK